MKPYFETEFKFEYFIQSTRKYTFEMPKIKKWVESYCRGRVLNLFAGKTLLNVNEYRVDIDQKVPADIYMDAYEYVKIMTENYDTVILDPPFSFRQARRIYNGKYVGRLTEIKEILSEKLNINTRVISLGYDSVGMGKGRGFYKIAICLICHSGDHNDTIGIVEERITAQLKLEI